MDVRLPDGRIISNVPDGTTKEELDKKLNGIATPKINETLSEPIQNEITKPEQAQEQTYSKSYLDSRITGKSWDDSTILGKALNAVIPQPKKIPAQLMRQLGLGTRGLAEGVGETTDFIETPIREGINLLAKPFQEQGAGSLIKLKTEAAIKPKLKSFNIPYAENRNERINQEAIKMLPITAGPNALIRGLNPTSYVGKNIQKSLLESEGKQLASGAAMGAAAQYAAEEGVGELGQLGYGTAASFLPFLTKGKGLVTTPKPIYKQNLNKEQTGKAIDLIDNYEYELAQSLKLGIDPQEAKVKTLKRLRLPEEKLNQSYLNASRPLNTFIKNNGEIDYAGINTSILNKQKADYKNPSMLTKAIDNTTTRIKALSEDVSNGLRFLDFQQHINVARKIEYVKPFLEKINKIKKQNLSKYNQLELFLYNEKHNEVLKIMKEIGPDAVRAWKNTQSVLNSTRNELLQSGFEINKTEQYFPRQVNNVDKLHRGLNIEQQTDLDKLLNNKLLSNITENIIKKDKNISRDEAIKIASLEIKDKGLNAKKDLSNDDLSNIYDSYIRGYGTNKLQLNKPGFTKQRTMGELTERELPYYEDASSRLLNYIRSSQKSIEQRRFMGQDIPRELNSEASIDSSLGRILSKESKNLSQKELLELRSLLVSRFGKGEESPSKSIATIKDIIYAGTLANPFSAGTQVGDFFQTSYQFGVKKSVGTLLKENQAKLSDLGLDDIINADLSKEKRVTSSALDFLLKTNFFKKADKIFKEVNMNTALREGKALSKNKEGLKQLENKWKKVMGNEYDSFIKDLQSGELTDNVRYYLWHNLADQQPISLSEMPQWYLDMPNGRVFYSLQSFALKQLDVVKRTIINEYKHGSKKQAMKNAVRYSLVIGGGQTAVDYTKDAGLGREINPYNIPKDILFNTIKVFGVSEYDWGTALKDGKIDEWFTKMWMPPLRVLTAPVEDAAFLLKKALDPDADEITNEDLYNLQTTRRIPYVGTILQNYLGGGKERYNERIENEKYN